MLLYSTLDNSLRRIIDVLAATLGLIILTPLFLIISIAIKKSDGGPVFYKARRVGKDEKMFKLYKFRTMMLDADKQGPGITTSGDSRITPVGHWLRHKKLDELPQLLNVCRGEMSLVGPRPEDPRYVALYDEEQRRILRVRPGITSAASLSFRNEETLLSGSDWEYVYCNEIMPMKLALDLAYIEKRTIWTDLTLIFRTISTMFR